MKSSKMKMCRLLQEVHRACYVKFSGATVTYTDGNPSTNKTGSQYIDGPPVNNNQIIDGPNLRVYQ